MGWISVKIKPKTDGDYLVFRPDAPIDKVRTAPFKRGEFHGAYDVTHWMPLPPPPSE